MEISPALFRFLAACLSAYAEERELINSLFGHASALAAMENIELNMNPDTALALAKIQAADTLLGKLAILLPALHTTISDLRLKVTAAADDKAKLDAATLQLAELTGEVKQFSDLGTHIGTVTDAVGTAETTAEGDVDPGTGGTDPGNGTGGAPSSTDSTPPTGTGDAPADGK